MNQIQINDGPNRDKSDVLTDSQIRIFLDGGRQEKLALLESWIPGWRSYRKWEILSSNADWNGLRGSLEDPKKQMPIGDIPDNWEEIIINPPR